VRQFGDDVAVNELELLMLSQMSNVVRRARKEVIKAYDLRPLCKESVAQVTADESSASGHNYSMFKKWH
jgi:hypothetical protein